MQEFKSTNHIHPELRWSDQSECRFINNSAYKTLFKCGVWGRAHKFNLHAVNTSI